jgi:hypothetical protein
MPICPVLFRTSRTTDWLVCYLTTTAIFFKLVNVKQHQTFSKDSITQDFKIFTKYRQNVKLPPYLYFLSGRGLNTLESSVASCVAPSPWTFSGNRRSAVYNRDCQSCARLILCVFGSVWGFPKNVKVLWLLNCSPFIQNDVEFSFQWAEGLALKSSGGTWMPNQLRFAMNLRNSVTFYISYSLFVRCIRIHIVPK